MLTTPLNDEVIKLAQLATQLMSPVQAAHNAVQAVALAVEIYHEAEKVINAPAAESTQPQ